MTLIEITSQAQHATVFVQANRNLGNFHVPVKAHLARMAVYPVSLQTPGQARALTHGNPASQIFSTFLFLVF